jgi:hypothetical protein
MTDVIHCRQLRATSVARVEAILDAHVDQGADAPRLIQQLHSQRRRVLIFHDGLPPDVLDCVLGGLPSTAIESGGFHFVQPPGHM